MSQRKTCSGCLASKDATAFGRDKAKADGLHPRCKECRRIERRARYAKDPERELTQVRAYRAQNKERCKQDAAKRFKKNRDIFRERTRDWRAKNVERARELGREWARRNPAKNAYRAAAARAARMRATPAWLTSLQKSAMREIYRVASECGGHVDHIEPLRGRDACGLHVPWNLQILTPQQNLKKGNRRVGAQ